MKKGMCIFLYTIYTLGLMIMLVFSGSKYDWMSDVDPSIASGMIEDSAGNRTVFLGLVLFVALLTQVLFFINNKKMAKRVLSVLFIIMAFFVFYLSVIIP